MQVRQRPTAHLPLRTPAGSGQNGPATALCCGTGFPIRHGTERPDPVYSRSVPEVFLQLSRSVPLTIGNAAIRAHATPHGIALSHIQVLPPGELDLL